VVHGRLSMVMHDDARGTRGWGCTLPVRRLALCMCVCGHMCLSPGRGKKKTNEVSKGLCERERGYT